MNVTEWTNLLKTRNAKNRLAGDATILAQQSALSNWVNGLLVGQGANPALWDYPPGISLGTSLTGNTASNVVTLPQDYIKNALLVRMTSTVGATPTASVAIQGSKDNVNWFPVDYSDSATPSVYTQAPLTITTAATIQKMIRPHQSFKFIRFNMTANTNVTITTADVTAL
jgi:hypothetical protein